MKTLIVVGVDPGSKKNEQGEPVGAWAALRVPYRRPARYISHGTGTAKQIIEAIKSDYGIEITSAKTTIGGERVILDYEGGNGVI